jgi:hypothetical protein
VREPRGGSFLEIPEGEASSQALEISHFALRTEKEIAD